MKTRAISLASGRRLGLLRARDLVGTFSSRRVGSSARASPRRLMAVLRWRRRLRSPRRTRREAPPATLRLESMHVRLSVRLTTQVWRAGARGNRRPATRVKSAFTAATGPTLATRIAPTAAIGARRVVQRIAATAAPRGSNPPRESTAAMFERRTPWRAPRPNFAQSQKPAPLPGDTARQRRGVHGRATIARASVVAPPGKSGRSEMWLPRRPATALARTLAASARRVRRSAVDSRPTWPASRFVASAIDSAAPARMTVSTVLQYARAGMRLSANAAVPSPRTPSHVTSVHAVDLVWRRVVTDTTSGNVDVPARRSTPLSSDTIRTTGTQSGAANTALAAARNAAAAARPMLDAATIDRLTDDVIRRVERRIRIERERRGF
jgi:hypothetical protein